jgi:alanine racemase
MTDFYAPARLRLNGDALVSNWRWLAGQSGAAACGAAIKANGYGTDARGVVARLAAAGCRDFFVATWGEGAALGDVPDGARLSVLHGVRDEDMDFAIQSAARPVLSSALQVTRWVATGLPCDVMVDTGMNRLGVSLQQVADGILTGLNIDTLMSHLASAEDVSSQNEAQRAAFGALRGKTKAKRMSLANSAGICLGPDYAFDLTRPGLALYGGVPCAAAAGQIAQVAFPQAQILQRRRIEAGDHVGYNATFTATAPMELAIINLGYADGYLRAFSGPDGVQGGSGAGGRLPVIGRVSMDLIALCVDSMPELGEGDWVSLDYDLPSASQRTGLSQYELLTTLGPRFDRIWA